MICPVCDSHVRLFSQSNAPIEDKMVVVFEHHPINPTYLFILLVMLSVKFEKLID